MMRALLLTALLLVTFGGLAQVDGAECGSIDTCGACLTNRDPTACAWCGEHSSGDCIQFNAICPNTKKDRSEPGDSCPPSPMQLVLPIIILQSMYALALVAVHLFQIKFRKLPVNQHEPLHVYRHLRRADQARVSEFEEEGLSYVDYEHKRDRHQEFAFLLGGASAAVCVAVLMGERLSWTGLIAGVLWWLVLVVMLVIKMFRRPRIYVLTEQRGLILRAKWCGCMGQRVHSYSPEEMHFVSVRSYKDGKGSVFFTTEDPLDETEEGSARLLGFESVTRSEEVYQLVARWRAHHLEEEMPTEVNRSPQPKRSLAARVGDAVVILFLLVFIVFFVAIFFTGEENGSPHWIVWPLVPFVLLWTAFAVFWIHDWWQLRKRHSQGFVVLDRQFAQITHAMSTTSDDSSSLEDDIPEAGRPYRADLPNTRKTSPKPSAFPVRQQASAGPGDGPSPAPPSHVPHPLSLSSSSSSSYSSASR